MTGAVSHTFQPYCRVLASAGSGKTYQLTSRYLELIAQPSPPSKVLASTFTRAAAGEIRNRVVMRLVESIHDAKKRKALAKAIGVESLPVEAIVGLLRNITENLHRLQVRTLDSFFASIVQTFALDLGLSDGCRIVEESEIIALRDEAIALLLDEDNPQPMIDLLRNLTTADSGRAVHDTINDKISELYELFGEATTEAWDSIPTPTGRLKDSELIDALELLRGVPLPKHKGIADTHAKYCEHVARRDWKSFLSKGIPGAILTSSETFWGKPITVEVASAYQPLIQHAAAELIERERNRNRAAQRLMTLFDEHFRQLKRRDGIITFSDLSPLLAQLLRGIGGRTEQDINRFMEICFRLDGEVDHLLLDEFQDTSISQWKALQPIAAEIMSGEGDRVRSFFCVGDVKQSIYGWRHASPEILERLEYLIHPDGSPASIHNDHLAKSWRSSQTIIDCVNRVFGTLPDNEAMVEYPAVAERWHVTFDRHETEKTEAPGYVELRMMERVAPRDAKIRNALRWKKAAELAADLYHRNPHLSIAILTRTNNAAGRLLFQLGPDGLDVPCGGRGKGSLTDAPVVEALLDLITLADHPGDTIAAYHVANSPAGELIDAPVDFATKANANKRLEASRRLREMFAERGFARTLAEWLPVLAPSCTEREMSRLFQLIDVAERFDATVNSGSGRADQFIKSVEEADIPDVRPAPIQVMTVHKAKGLEFDAVILADLECRLRGNHNPAVAYERDGDAGPITKICKFLSQDIQPLVPELKPMFDGMLARNVREHLSLLYVAITRAKHGLYMFVDPLSEKEPKLSPCLSGVLIGAFSDKYAAAGSVLYQDGDADWMDKAEAKEKRAARERVQIRTPVQLPSAKRRPTKTADAPSRRHGEGEAAPTVARRNRDADDRGVALHALLQQIDWLEESTFDDDSLDRILKLIVAHRDADWRRDVIAEFRHVITNANMKRQLSRAEQMRDADSIDVHRELLFARSVGGAAQRGSIDRLVVRRKNGKIIGAEVIDFKTDQFKAGAVDVIDHAQRYAAQLDDYRAAAAKLLRVDPELIERIVYFVTIDQVVGLS